MGLVLVALPRETKFVAITEVVHRQIMAAQAVALRARDEVRERFTALALRGAPADFVVRQLGQTLGAPVVLENLAHEVIAAEVPLDREHALFVGWQDRSRQAHEGRESAEHPGRQTRVAVVPVEARGVRWGFLIALPGPSHAAGRLAVMEQAAIALALGRLTDGGEDEWSRLSQGALIESLLEGRYAGVSEIEARLGAAGLPVAERVLYGLVFAGTRVRAEAVARAVAEWGGRMLLGAPPRGMAAPAYTALLSLPSGAWLPSRSLRTLAAAIAEHPENLVMAIGSAAEGIDDALLSVREAIALALAPREGSSARGPLIRQSDGRPLMRLLTSLRSDPRLLEMGERLLAPLVAYDEAKRGDLCDVLAAILARPSNRTAAAAAAHLSRSVLYQRLALIQELLDADLDDGETQTALHLALLVRRSAIV